MEDWYRQLFFLNKVTSVTYRLKPKRFSISPRCLAALRTHNIEIDDGYPFHCPAEFGFIMFVILGIVDPDQLASGENI